MKPQLTLTLPLVVFVIGSILAASPNQTQFDKANLGVVPPPQTITICKRTIPAGGKAFPFSWANGSGPLPSFSLDDTQCSVKNVTGLDHYNKFTENVPAGWNLTDISCNNTTSPVKIIGANANPGFEPGDNTITIDLNETNVTCTFVNELQPKCCHWSFDLSTGKGSISTDPQWKVNNGNAYVVSNLSNLSGVWMLLPPASWIQPMASGTPVYANADTYRYTLEFAIPSCGCSHVQLTGSFAADNSAQAYLDGNPIPGASCPGPTCFKSTQAPVSLNGAPAMTAGMHTLEIDVKNDGPNASYSGLIVNARLTRTCP